MNKSYHILFGFSITNGCSFAGPYDSLQEAEQVKDNLEFDEAMENICVRYKWEIIQLYSLADLQLMITQNFTQVR